MREINYGYVCKNMANVACFPVMHYHNGELMDHYSLIPFPCNPVGPYIEQLLKSEKSIAYFRTPQQFYFGVVTHGADQIVIGPIPYCKPESQMIRDYAQTLGLNNKDSISLRNALHSIPHMGIQHFMHMLAMINYYVSDEIVDLTDFLAPAGEGLVTAPIAIPIEEPPDFPAMHTTSVFENTMLQCVEEGDSEKLLELFKKQSPGNIGKTSKNALRQTKNTFIVTATLVSRAAIRGGLDLEEAMTMSDLYIQRSEPMHSVEQVLMLNFEMVTTYCRRVAEAIAQGPRSKFVRSISGYIKAHISEPIKIEQICDAFFMSRSWLTARFKEDTGMTISDFIMEEKIKEAKRMLSSSNCPVVEISNALGFSSQSHFQNAFKRSVGMTPKQFRNKS